ncbi:MAG TPA: BolA/IbaG family iron-sulfur metabolism protein [Burkholderiaceae bacterium]|jgi:BolA protein|nr:BolA/IbaG family iron-sulfur metabolism protein [Burkholderiaceae bacterium]
MSTRLDEIRRRLDATFSPLICLLEDDSAAHAGHAGAASGGGHYRLKLVSAVFEGRNRVTRHRLVYDCLLDLMHKDIHAIAIIALAPSEVAS